MKIYLASSWRNPHQADVLAQLRAAGHEVYDFKNPAPGNSGFSWRQCDEADPKTWTPDQYLKVLDHPVARRGFGFDMKALADCDACVLVLPCGRSAHLELGFATGAGKRTIVLLDKTIDEPELMYLMCDRIVRTVEEAKRALLEEMCIDCGQWSRNVISGDEGGWQCMPCHEGVPRGGPSRCPTGPCADCDGPHHFDSEYVGFPEDEPGHPGAKLDLATWWTCKHCDAWIDGNVDLDEVDVAELFESKAA